MCAYDFYIFISDRLKQEINISIFNVFILSKCLAVNATQLTKECSPIIMLSCERDAVLLILYTYVFDILYANMMCFFCKIIDGTYIVLKIKTCC